MTLVQDMKTIDPTKFSGALIGLAVGDSLGAGIEGINGFMEVREITERYTDDTAMMLGVAESLTECGRFDQEHLIRRFIEIYEKEPWRGYGSGPPKIFRMIGEGVQWRDLPDRLLYPGGSFGNGAAMRVAPVGLFCFNDMSVLRDIAYASSLPTHSNNQAREGAALLACAVSLALKDEESFIEQLMQFTGMDIYKEKLETILRLRHERDNRLKVIKELGNGIEAVNSVPTSIYSYFVSKDFEDSVAYSVSLGGDTDTIAAMTGAVSGARWGLSNIPLRWREKLENREYIEKLGLQLWSATYRVS